MLPTDFKLILNHLSTTLLKCGVHSCKLKCHPASLVDHTKVLCLHIMIDACSKGHEQKRKCHQNPLPCKKCAKELAELEEKLRKEFEAEQRREAQSRAHEQRMKELEEKILAEQQRMKDAELAQERAQALEQKQADLDTTKGVVTSFLANLSLPKVSSPVSPSPQTSPQANGLPSSSSVPPARPATPPGNPATANSTTAEKEWQRQKEVEGADSAAVDKIMEMIGLDDVKRQILRIKDKIDVTKRQNTSLKSERFNVVLLGNPGTGAFGYHHHTFYL